MSTEQDKEKVQVRFYDEGRHELSLKGSMVPYKQNDDGTWYADGYIYKYRLELTGRLPNAAMDSTYTVLSNDPDLTFDEVAMSMFSSSIDDHISMEIARIVDLGTGKAAQPSNEFRSFEEVKSLLPSYSNDPILVDEIAYAVIEEDISKMEVLNGNDGRIITLEPGTNEFAQVLNAYQNLEYEPLENPDDSERRIGYLYRLSIYDSSGTIAQTITPYMDMIKINGEIYNADMNRTAADLISQLELLF